MKKNTFVEENLFFFDLTLPKPFLFLFLMYVKSPKESYKFFPMVKSTDYSLRLSMGIKSPFHDFLPKTFWTDAPSFLFPFYRQVTEVERHIAIAPCG